MITSSLNDTICAIATVLGTGGVSIIRLSGADSESVISKIFFKNNKFNKTVFNHNSIVHGYIYDEQVLIDEVIVLCFREPNSYTGENVFEIQCHGGVNVTKMILDLCLKNGARLAQRGEFTKRAFLNAKMDLSQAESVLDVINAKTQKFAQISANNLCGKLGKKISLIRDDVINLLTHIVAAIDFPEEVEEPDFDNIALEIKNIINEIDLILKGTKNSNLMRQGINIAIVGKPNVGKSSLFNNILSYDRAIVTDIAGTTRDIITETLDINGFPVTLTDTAGIRTISNDNSANVIENIGIDYSKKAIASADIVMFLTDLSSEPNDDDKEIFNLLNDKKYIIVGTKSDLPIQNTLYQPNICISNTNAEDIDKLIQIIGKLIENDIKNEDSEFFTNARQQESLMKAKNSLLNAKNSAEQKMEQDFLAIDIKSALMSLGEISGDDITQEIINNIFEKFCIGK